MELQESGGGGWLYLLGLMYVYEVRRGNAPDWHDGKPLSYHVIFLCHLTTLPKLGI